MAVLLLAWTVRASAAAGAPVAPAGAAAAVGAASAPLAIADIDAMSGQAFENVVRRLLESRGYQVGNLRASNDYGVDLIATKGAERFAVQAKRSKHRVSRPAVSDAVAGRDYRGYGCNAAMVVTNNEFTEDAREVARGTGCVLVGRAELLQWIAEFNRAQGAAAGARGVPGT